MSLSLRSLLYVPGDSPRKIEKAAGELHADALILDLEDAVALGNKELARRTVADALGRADFRGQRRLVRINAVGTPLAMDDLAATVAGRPDGYVLPKVEAATEVQAVAAFLSQAERERGWPEGSIPLLPMVETARGLLSLTAVAAASERVGALVLGGEDFASDIGAHRTPAGWELFFARSQLVVVARAYGVQALDTVFVTLDDLAGLEAECQSMRQLGFDGKCAIHPRQIDIIQRAFTPTPEEVARAQRLVDAFTAHQTAAQGVFVLDGKMVDKPMLRAAERVLAKAQPRSEP